ncbi:MAG TPA: response regulator, partial [Bryobacteraceae bacterium]|nr:response regulator [Bryobacteraceae bacterium]
MEKAPVKILVVDDESRICENVKKILSKNNYEVEIELNAQSAMDRLARESFSLLISDIVMPGKNGLELLKLVKQQWPLTKAMIMTAYASTDTAMKAIRLGAADYIPKPFTPDELRSKVDRVLAGGIEEVRPSSAEVEMIDVIDIDAPFEAREVGKATGEDYVKMLGRSDLPVVEVKLPAALPNYCEVGSMVCDIFKKLGATCKAGVKSGECPQKKGKKVAAKSKGEDVRRLVGIDQPFFYDEVVSLTGPEYVHQLGREGIAYKPYEQLRQEITARLKPHATGIDADIPFDLGEVEAAAGQNYAVSLSRSDVTVVEVKVPEALPNYCEVGAMVCDIFKKLGATCKAGTKSAECPQLKAKKKQLAAGTPAASDVRWIGPDLPFDAEAVAAAAGPAYLHRLQGEGQMVMPYEELKRSMAGRVGRKLADTAAAVRKAEPLRILIIDDEVAVNNNIRKILVRKGYAIEQATSKTEALAKMGAGVYALVVLDLKMPGVTGLELLAAARTLQPAARVIIVTGFATIETAVEGARMGAVGYVPKPFT